MCHTSSAQVLRMLLIFNKLRNNPAYEYVDLYTKTDIANINAKSLIQDTRLGLVWWFVINVVIYSIDLYYIHTNSHIMYVSNCIYSCMHNQIRTCFGIIRCFCLVVV